MSWRKIRPFEQDRGLTYAFAVGEGPVQERTRTCPFGKDRGCRLTDQFVTRARQQTFGRLSRHFEPVVGAKHEDRFIELPQHLLNVIAHLESVCFRTAELTSEPGQLCFECG